MAESKFSGTALAKGFKTDKAKESNGVWRDHESGISVRIRRSSLNEHKMALRKFYKPFQHLTNVNPRDELLVKQKAAAQELVADWGVKDRDGKMEPLRDASGAIINPTETNVLDAFIEMPDFFAWVSDEADTFEHYRADAAASAGGNLSTSSGGIASGAEPKATPSSNGEQRAASPSQDLSVDQL